MQSSANDVSFDHFIQKAIRQSTHLLFDHLPVPVVKAYIIAKLYLESGKNVLIVTGEGQEETRLKNDVEFFTGTKVLDFPSWETLPSEKVLPSREIVGVRQKTLQILAEKKSETPYLVMSSLQATLQRIPSKKTIEKGSLVLRVGLKKSMTQFVEELIELGYDKVSLTVSRGEFSVRGGLIDIFIVDRDVPVRVEFFGDEIDSIRLYNPDSQKTIEEIPHIQIVHALEFLQRATDDFSSRFRGVDYSETLFSLLGQNETIVALDDIEKLEDRYTDLIGYNALMKRKSDGEQEDSSGLMLSLQEWLSSIRQASSWCMLTEKNLEELTQEIQTKKSSTGDQFETLSFSLFSEEWKAVRPAHPFEAISNFYYTECLYDALPHGEMLLDGYAQTRNHALHTFVVQSDIEKEWIESKLKDRGADFEGAKLVYGYLSSGFARRDTKELFIPMSELLGRIKTRRDSESSAKKKQEVFQTEVSSGFDAYDLEPQDTVVHFHHGIGTFLGIETRPNVQGVEQEFFLIQYAEGSKLFVPLHQAHLITKYIGAGDLVPKLHALGSSKWKKTREETEKAIVGFASDLLKAHAHRELAGGIEYPPDGPKTVLFSAEFPYEETVDQLKAIADITKDMCSKKSMDRLVCGDVGYGKTEVAMRAAFKAVADGNKQVALLVPTTVLAMQHYENFVERMTPFGISIGILSRFQTMKENRQTLEKIQSGKIHILIGTHKLLQKSVEFHDLGLVIIDEEQRFGVKAKEYLKIMKHGVDCLTLSATPIPRTLYMSLVGAKDLSTIATPPYDRLPIKTSVIAYDEEILEAAILREMNRGGQVYFIHNRVETIFEACERLRKIVPRARITAVHGQMDSDEIDLVFHAFKRGDIDILVATTIIENGIDMPNANTIIIERADRFGISELYQLRGRVGRSNKRAFCYFLVPNNRVLSEISRKRIDAIAKSGGYGGGLQVAMRDLEIRGAGDILGTEQSGHVTSIGFHLYCKLLKRTMKSLQGTKTPIPYDTKIEIPYLAKLPEDYVNDVSLRIEIYQRLGESDSIEEIDAIQSELIDRFGALPKPVEWLLIISKLRIFAARQGITLLKVEKYSVTFEKKRGSDLVTNQHLLPKVTTAEEMYQALKRLILL